MHNRSQLTHVHRGSPRTDHPAGALDPDCAGRFRHWRVGDRADHQRVCPGLVQRLADVLEQLCSRTAHTCDAIVLTLVGGADRGDR